MHCDANTRRLITADLKERIGTTCETELSTSTKKEPIMEYPHILFQITESTSFVPRAGFSVSDTTTQTLETLLEESRRATSFLEDELQKRRSISVPTTRVNQSLLKLRKDADLIKTRERLDEKSIGAAKGLLRLMTGTHSERNARVCQEFLIDVLKHCSPQCTFICAISLGKHKIANLREEERSSLLKLLKIE